MIRFCAKKDFSSEETRSHYCKGFYYSMDGREAIVCRWVEEGKVELGETLVRISGAGEVR